MATETERKFLVKSEFRHMAVREISITQFYLVADHFKTVRVRIADDKAFLTIKSPAARGTITRSEWEYLIPVSDAKEMMKISLPGKIVKSRYLIPYGNHTYEVDVFHDKNEGLIIAEIELSEANEYFERPEWLGEEVTGQAQFYNSNLIK